MSRDVGGGGTSPEAGSDTATTAAVSRSATLTAAGGLVLAAALGGAAVPAFAPLFLLLMAGGLFLALRALRGREPAISPGVAAALVAGSTLLTSRIALADLGVPGVLSGGLALVVVAAAVLASGVLHSGSRSTWSGIVVLAMALLATLVGLTHRFRDHIDVLVLLETGAQRLVHGVDPYLPGYPNIYPPERSALLYGPGVLGPDGRLTFGLPYPPVSLLVVTPSHLLGDVRFVAIAAVVVLPLLLFAVGGRASRLPAAMLACAPGLVPMVVNGWTELLIVALLGLAVLAAGREQWAVAAALLGLALASKQYFVVVLPCLWLLRPWLTRKRLAALVLPALAVTVPFIVWDPAAFWHSIVQFQLAQPLRADSTSLLTWSVAHLGWPPPSVFGALPLGAGLLAALACGWRMRPGVDSFLVALSVSLLVTIALSKQAFTNYFFLVGGLLILAAWSTANVRYLSIWPSASSGVEAPRRGG